MNRPVAIVFVDPWSFLTLAACAVLLVVALSNLWRSTRGAALTAALEQQCADLCERAGMHAEAAEFCRRAQRWQRLAWPRRVPPAKSLGPGWEHRQGWRHCSPDLLATGVDCADTPRRPCECFAGGGHDHLVHLASERGEPTEVQR